MAPKNSLHRQADPGVLRRLEFLLFYGLLPVLIALFMPTRLVFPMLFGLILLGLVLLPLTQGFTWRELTKGWWAVGWRLPLGFVAGVGFAWAFQVQRSFALAVVLHAVAGITLFAFGMGDYIYSGNVQRPF